jgi:hypothetical protein
VILRRTRFIELGTMNRIVIALIGVVGVSSLAFLAGMRPRDQRSTPQGGLPREDGEAEAPAADAPAIQVQPTRDASPADSNGSEGSASTSPRRVWSEQEIADADRLLAEAKEKTKPSLDGFSDDARKYLADRGYLGRRLDAEERERVPQELRIIQEYGTVPLSEAWHLERAARFYCEAVAAHRRGDTSANLRCAKLYWEELGAAYGREKFPMDRVPSIGG